MRLEAFTQERTLLFSADNPDMDTKPDFLSAPITGSKMNISNSLMIIHVGGGLSEQRNRVLSSIIIIMRNQTTKQMITEKNTYNEQV